MSSSRPAKRRRMSARIETVENPEAGPTTLPVKSKAKSCETCRRLKTRCEVQEHKRSCHRCDVLKLECSFNTLPHVALSQSSDSSTVHRDNSRSVCDCNERLLALESSLADVRSLLNRKLDASDENLSPHVKENRSENKSNLNEHVQEQPSSPQYVGPRVADRNSRHAPMSLIWDMNQHILGSEKVLRDSAASEDVFTQGILTEELASTLLAGFSQLSRRWLFMSSNIAMIRQKSPLLFATCILAGLQIDSTLHGSEVHHALFQHVNGLLGRSMLASPLSLEAIQSMLILSMWNLVPNKDTEHIDSWILSGLAAMHGMVAINFEQLVKVRKDGRVDPRSRETIRSWNLICLCHLQFSVGTGRPPVVSRQYLDQCADILRLPSYNSRDQLVAAGVRLYSSLCELVNSDVVQTDKVAWKEIDDWRQSCGQFYDLDSSKPLRFAYSCCYLILARRTLKYLSEPPAEHCNTTPKKELDAIFFIKLAIEHAHNILNIFLATSDLSAFVRPAYENLLCSFAMVTLSEFATYLADSAETLTLMERTSIHIQLGGRAEPVAKWALNVLRRHVFDSRQSREQGEESNDIDTTRRALGEPGDINIIIPDTSEYLDHWGTGLVADQDFPSLEDMFFGI